MPFTLPLTKSTKLTGRNITNVSRSTWNTCKTTISRWTGPWPIRKEIGVFLHHNKRIRICIYVSRKYVRMESSFAEPIPTNTWSCRPWPWKKPIKTTPFHLPFLLMPKVYSWSTDASPAIPAKWKKMRILTWGTHNSADMKLLWYLTMYSFPTNASLCVRNMNLPAWW